MSPQGPSKDREEMANGLLISQDTGKGWGWGSQEIKEGTALREQQNGKIRERGTGSHESW